MGTYTYLAADTMTGRILAELPLRNVSYDICVNRAASLAATLPLSGVAPGMWEASTPGRTSIYVDLDGVIVWGGILWGRQYTKSGKALALDAKDFGSYLDHIYITSDLAYTGVDQLAIARSLVDYAMNKGGSNLRLSYTGTLSSGVARDRTYLGADQGAVGARLAELSAVDDGFDFRFLSRWEGGYLRRVVQLAYPTLGRTYPASGLTFDFEADATDLTWAEDGANSASLIYAVGALPAGGAAGTNPKIAVSNAAVMASGIPRLESVLTFDSISTLGSLIAQANGALAVSAWPLQTMTLGVRDTGSTPPLGSYVPGDQVCIRVGAGGDLWPNTAIVIATVTAISVAVDDQSDQAITLELAPLSITLGAAA